MFKGKRYKELSLIENVSQKECEIGWQDEGNAERQREELRVPSSGGCSARMFYA